MQNIQRLRGNSSTSPAATAYTGPVAELIVDTDLWAIRIQDGVTPGGHLLTSSSNNAGPRDMRTVLTGTSYTVGPMSSAVTQVVWRSSTSGSKSTTIPGPSTTLKGFQLDIKLTLGNNDSHTITPTSGTIEGGANLTLNDNKDNISLVADSSNTDWILV